MFIASIRRIPINNTLGYSAVVSCENEFILLCEMEFSVVLYSMGLELCINLTVDFVVKKNPNKWRPMSSDRDLCF